MAWKLSVESCCWRLLPQQDSGWDWWCGRRSCGLELPSRGGVPPLRERSLCRPSRDWRVYKLFKRFVSFTTNFVVTDLEMRDVSGCPCHYPGSGWTPFGVASLLVTDNRVARVMARPLLGKYLFMRCSLI